MSDYCCSITQVTIHRRGDNPLIDPGVTTVSLDDVGGGVFLALQQHGHHSEGQVLLDPEELPALQYAAQLLLQQASLQPPTAPELTLQPRPVHPDGHTA